DRGFRLGRAGGHSAGGADVRGRLAPWSQASDPGPERAAARGDARIHIRFPDRHPSARGQGRRGDRPRGGDGGSAGTARRSLGVLRVPSWYQAVASPSEAGLTGPSPEITPVAHFYVVSKNISDPRVDGSAWRLNIGGLVDKPQRISLSDLRARPSTSEFATLECISNDVGGGLMSTGSFTGVRLRDLIATA